MLYCHWAVNPPNSTCMFLLGPSKFDNSPCNPVLQQAMTHLCSCSGDMGAPSSTPYPQSGANMPPAASIDAANLPAVNNGSIGIVTRFSAGARVWFDNNGVPVRGTVAKPHAAGKIQLERMHADFTALLQGDDSTYC